MRNHGDSPRSPDHGYAAMAGDLAETIDALGGRADVLGHSMGGKAAMVLALTEPGRVAPADRRRHRAGRLRPQPDRATCGRCRRSTSPASPAAPRPTPRSRAGGRRSRRCAPSCCRASRSAKRRARLEAEPPRPRRPDAADHGLPDLAGRFDGPALFLTGGGVGLRPARALAAHPRALPRRRASRRSPAPATGCTPTRRRAFVAAVQASSRALTRGLDARPAPLLKGGARRSSSAGRARHS